MTPNRTRKVHCNDCGGERIHHVLNVERLTWDNEEAAIHGGTDYETLKCGGCEKVVLRESEWCTEDGEDGATVRSIHLQLFVPYRSGSTTFGLSFHRGKTFCTTYSRKSM